MLKMVDPSNYDRAKALKAFDDTKAGVKGLVDAGITELPPFFLNPPEDLPSEAVLGDIISPLEVPTIDLGNNPVEEIRHACETWGFFRVVNHGIPQKTMDAMIEGVRRFNEQPSEARAAHYSRETMKKIRFNSNFDLYKAKTANWRDTLACVMAPDPPEYEEYPEACRDIMLEYSKEVKKLGRTLFRLISQALGLEPDHLEKIDCTKGHVFFCHYYPACPESDRTLGHAKHTDPAFLTVLLQDHIGGLQVLNGDRWIDVRPVRGALVINVGDLLQLVSNDRFRSVEHRVVASGIGPRVSAACFFTTHFKEGERVHGPIAELVSEASPAVYKETTIREYIDSYLQGSVESQRSLFSDFSEYTRVLLFVPFME